jgi:putative transposase
MPIRKYPLVTGQVYHIYNRGVARKPIFFGKRDYERFVELVDYYRYEDYPMKFSRFNKMSPQKKCELINRRRRRLISLISYKLMPNHFHFLVRQFKDNGISRFVRRLCGAYTNFVNIKYERVGSLFQGRFKTVLIETEAQLLHVVRYVHINAYTGFVVKDLADLESYPWSSLREYLRSNTGDESALTDKTERESILGCFDSIEAFRRFTLNEAEYKRDFEAIKHLIIE